MGFMTQADSDKLHQQLVDEAKAAKPRPIFRIANEILEHWPKPFHAAIPYIKAMRDLTKITDHYGCESASTIIVYFLANSSTFRGEQARRLKDELRAMLK